MAPRNYTLSAAALAQRQAAALGRGRQLANDPAHQSAAAKALVAKMHPRYFKLIGHMGGCIKKKREYEKYAATLPPDMAEAWLERAQDYAVQTGNQWISQFWTRDELADEPLIESSRKSDDE